MTVSISVWSGSAACGSTGGVSRACSGTAGGRVSLLCRSVAHGQETRQEEGGAAAEKRPVIRDAHERFQF